MLAVLACLARAAPRLHPLAWFLLGSHLLGHAFLVGVWIRMCLLAGGQETRANPDRFSSRS